ncbi:DUF2087 domain-containing protein [Actinacidiphila sp. DG2A-62]|uniref:DUF2087 domain-containing protein n=1 Tax=Actinacidiphila sp. DG2A-62 TaxID=3108821 RepID=UPI002DBBA413|nr:DUF2087 domain-containing protein [Actinacidiphila sp. DG2A-62]MEC3994334.1 DUF2087 domain-containing protein [Actinacidiphila sp. DG2A-62]
MTGAETQKAQKTHKADAAVAAGVADLFVQGRVVVVPRRPARRRQLLTHLAQTLFGRERDYSEEEVNEALLRVHDDPSALRRYLVEEGLLTRTPDGRRYWRDW